MCYQIKGLTQKGFTFISSGLSINIMGPQVKVKSWNIAEDCKTNSL